MTTAKSRPDRIRHALELLRGETTDTVDAVVDMTPSEFSDPIQAQQERDLIFGRVPSIVAHSSEIARPYDFMTVRMPRNNVIVVRQKDGSVKAFVNACRHRGAMLEENEKGRCRVFSCPYHRWSYDPDGSLRMVTFESTFGEIDHAEHGLVELPCEERHGFVWIIDRPNVSIDVAAWLGPEVDHSLADYHLDELVCFRSAGFDQPTNWKILQDAFLDSYHVQYAHPNTAGKVIHTNTMAFEDFGRHCRFIAPRKSIDRWLEEDPGERNLDSNVIETHFLLPNSTLLHQPDHFQLLTFRPHPTDPTTGRMEQRVIVTPVEKSGMEEDHWNQLWEKNWQILLTVLHNEDFPLLRGAQAALTSADAGGLVLGRNEAANQVFRREIRKLLAAGQAEA